MSEEVREITKAQSFQVEGLLALAKYHKNIVDECEEALRQIVEPQEENYSGHSGDAIWSGYTTKELIKRTNCKVTK